MSKNDFTPRLERKIKLSAVIQDQQKTRQERVLTYQQIRFQKRFSNQNIYAQLGI
jgi:hypothetical protein